MFVTGGVLLAMTSTWRHPVHQGYQRWLLTSQHTLFTPFLLWIGFREKMDWIDFLVVVIASEGFFLLSTEGCLTFQTGNALEVTGI